MPNDLNFKNFIIPDEETIISIDTNVIRDLCEDKEEPKWLLTFEEMANDKYHFCLSDPSFAELVNQRKRGSISSEKWKRGLERALRFLSKTLPVLPGKKEIFYMSGLRDIENTYVFDPDFEQCLSKAALKYFLDIGDNFKPSFSFDYKGKEQSFSTENFESSLQKERDSWIKIFEENRDRSLEETLDDLDKDFSGQPKFSKRADYLIKYFYYFFYRSKKIKEPYNPKNDDKRNDGIDFLHFFCFLLPSLFCTTETTGKFKLPLPSKVKSYQQSWIYKADDLASAYLKGNICPPSWENC